MRLQTKLSIFIFSLLAVAVFAISFFNIRSTTQSMLSQTTQDGEAIAQVLAKSSSFADRIPAQVENVLGEQMVVEARITANMIAIAVGRAGMSSDEINTILKNITSSTVLNEFWISDEDGKVNYSNTGIDFTFNPDPQVQPQAYIFYQLLGETNGAVKQEAMKREIDTRLFKYVGVSGIDKPRIVQVGYEATVLDELSKDVNIQKLVDELTGQANVAAIRVLDINQNDIAVSKQPVDGIGTSLSSGDLGLINESISTRTVQSSVVDNILRVATPVFNANNDVQQVAVVYLTTVNVQSAIRSSIIRSIVVSLIVIILGVVISFLLSNSITRPIRKLTAAAQAMGKGDLSRRVKIESRDEVGILADGFNKMADDLQSHIQELRRTTALKERMQKEMEIGTDIQKTFLPETAPKVEGFDIAALNTPALEVGGDFYDFIPVSPDKWGIVIADVSGKGVPAALFMAMSRTLIRAYGMGNPTVSETVLRANRMLSEEGRANMFVTMFYGVIDGKRKTLTYVNAGHNPPFISSPSESDKQREIVLAAKGIALGVMTDIKLEEKEVSLHKGEIILLYTDGVTEAFNVHKEQFGQARLMKLVVDYRSLSAQELIKRIEKEVKTFSEGQDQFDDITLMAVKVI